MTSATAGSSTSKEVEVLGASPRGIWLLVREREYFLSAEQFPWFTTARLCDIFDVQLEHGHSLRWPALDVDLEIESIEAPDRYPIVAR